MNENREDENFRVILEENSKFLLRPNATNKIFKDECMLSMRTPFTSGGVYLNLKTFESFAEEFLPFDFERTKNKIYLHIQKKKKKKKNEEKVDEKVKQEEEITKIALGAHGGFDVLPAEEVSSFYEIFIFPEKVAFPLDHPFVTPHLLNVVNGVIESEGNNVSCHIENWEEEIKVSKYSRDLPYAFEGLPALQCKKISPHPNDWKCEDCGASTNLWLNLSDGYIGCGRKIFSVGGGCQNGDEGAALRHYYTTGSKYPLAVKLGTITPHSADVFSYAREENDKVIDLHLAEHLERFGIKIQQLEKTEKTTTELEVHRNLQFDWTVVTEENESLKKLVGPGFVGLENLGNSCYMNSVLQMIISLRETKQKFVDFFEDIIHSLPNDSPPSEDFCIQFSKLASAISNSPAYLTEGLDLSKDEVYLSPRMIRQIVARNHPEFHSSRQQDAEEYLSYFLEVLEENEKNLNFRMKKKKKQIENFPTDCISSLFKFTMEHRLQCCQSKQVRYMETVSHALSLDIREEKAENFDEILRCRENDNLCKKQKLCEQNDDKNEKKSSGSVEEKSLSGNEKEREEQEKQNDATKCAAAKSNSTACHSGDVGEPIRPKIKLQTLLEEWAAEEIRKDYFSPVTKTVGDATNRNRMKTFPEYLILHIKRFYAKEDWTAAKQDCYVLVDDVLDLEKYRGVGKAEEETEMKEEDNEIKKEIKNEKKKKFEANEVLVAVLEELGFPHNLAVNACIATSNGREEECVDWCIQNFENTKMQEEIVYPNEEGEEDDTQKGKDEEKKEEKEEHSSNIVNSNSHSFMSLSSAEKEIIQQITCMGFDEENSIYAYRIIKNEKNKNAQRDGNSINVNTYTDECIQLLLNYSPEEIKRKYEESEERRKDEEACKNRSSVCADGPGVYELYGLITHLGKSANCGHYVCHLNHPTLGWVIYNDRKVAQSKNPPKQFGYIYIYRRKT